MSRLIDRPRLLCFACTPAVFDRLHRALRDSSLRVLFATTADQAVALCVAQTVAVAVLHAESIRGHEWSVARSLKMVRPALPILLLDDRKSERDKVPDDVDVCVGLDASDAELLRTLERLLGEDRGQESASAAQ
jgi:hypothetical protein